VVGFITSSGGAAVHDFISILRRRGWSGRLVILPSKVQGREAAAEMAAQLAAAARLGIFELLVIGRGGGSLEDLWAFNEEALVRAVAACPIPVISAVGHETDFSLCDFAADRRAETPSAAAELISSAFIEQTDRLAAAAETLRVFADTALERRRARLDLYTHRWQAASPQNFIENASLRLDDLAARAQSALSEHWQTHRESLHGVTARLAALSPVARLSVENARIENLSGRLTFMAANAMKPRRMALENLGRRLEEAGVTRVLARGFVLLADTAGKPLTRRAQLKPGQHVRARFADGEAGLIAESETF
jgi:exodeoxyribonuclease VII large subunit